MQSCKNPFQRFSNPYAAGNLRPYSLDEIKGHVTTHTGLDQAM
jgi:hypothetical protein